MTEPSQIPVTKDWFIALLEAQDDIADVRVQYGRDPEEPHEVIPVTDTGPNWTQEWVGVGQDRARDEKFSLTFYVIVKTPGLTQKQATDRAFEIFAVVEATVLDYTTTHGEMENIITVKVDPVDWAEIPFKEGYGALIEAQLSVHSRI